MKLYRFSPITSEKVFFQALKHVHIQAYKLCKQNFGKYLDNAGNIGIFCHYNSEYEQLIKLRNKLVFPSKNPNQKYFLLRKPIVIRAKGDIPETIYTHLYIRRPDPYRHYVGDIDFFLEPKKYQKLKLVLNKKQREGMRVFDRADLDMIELYNPDNDVIAYVSTKHWTERVRIKRSSATNL